MIWGRFVRDTACMGGLICVLLVLLAAVVGPWLSPYLPNETNLAYSHQPPSWQHPCGTDQLGRDVLSRVLSGARISLTIGVLSRLLALGIGGLLGVVAGYYGGWLDTFLMRLVEMVMAIPMLLLALVLAAVLGPTLSIWFAAWGVDHWLEPNLVALFVTLGLVGWAELARLLRGQVLAARQLGFVEAARAYGAPDARIIWRHILPNCTGPVLVWLSLGMAGAIMAESGLSFLGLGVAQPAPSWGSMISSGLIEMRRAPWLTLAPGVALALTVLGFNLLGDGLRDVLDPRSSQDQQAKS